MEAMRQPEWYQREGRNSLRRLLVRLRDRFKEQVDTPEWQVFEARLDRHFEALFRPLHQLYGEHYDFFYHLEQIVRTTAEHWMNRSGDLKALDAVREEDPHWFQSHRMVGGVVYVDLFAGNLAGMRERIPYLKELGITYLHLMPLFRSPTGDNDGGYAISSYREVDERLGTMAEFEELARLLRTHGISVCVDFVFNHTSDEHDWARQALAGDEAAQACYRMFENRTLPDQYERTLRSVFPDEHPGCFTYRSAIKKWVWTTFHNYQWDLNYENPEVFNRMTGELLFLANQGVEILRLDAVAFLWKRMGTSCENLPEAHLIIQAFNAVTRLAAPAMAFKSEAIVHPDEVLKYIAPGECQLSYNPMLMALLWSSLATRDVKLLVHGLRRRFALDPGCAWINYIRCHDDIGWTFSDDDAAELGINPHDHRRFLNEFYTGRFAGSFATGVPFQENKETGDARVCGTTASLCGLESALGAGDQEGIELAVRRVLLLHGVIFTIGGIPLVYLGDETGMLNDHSYEASAELAGDSRWVHRPKFDWDRAGERHAPASPVGRICTGIMRLVQLRQASFAFTRSSTELVDTGNDRVLGYFRSHPEQTLLVLANFSDEPQEIAALRLRQLGMRRTFTDIFTGRAITAADKLEMLPCEFMVLVGRQSA